MHSQRLLIPATPEDYEEQAYLRANPDVAAAVERGDFRDGRSHFEAFGVAEARRMRLSPDHDLREHKRARLLPLLRQELKVDGSRLPIDTLSPDLRARFGVVETSNISAHEYDPRAQELIRRHAQGLVLDCGAGQRNSYFGHVVNYEIAAYDSTDVLGVAECLPFIDDCFDAVISLNVLEHVKDPFGAARELVRVLKPGGELLCCVPFLQPLHGYPNHYYNMTHQGLLNLFEGLDERQIEVYGEMRPMWALSWMLQAYARGLPESERDRFESLSVADLMRDPRQWRGDPIVESLAPESNLELAAGCLLTARKPQHAETRDVLRTLAATETPPR